MTDRLTALRKLRDKVKAGGKLCDAYTASEALGDDHLTNLAADAHHGSLDAAKALHEAVLPGWVVGNMGQGVCNDPASPWTVWLLRSDYLVSDLQAEGKDPDPARAWLIAILKALIAQEEGK